MNPLGRRESHSTAALLRWAALGIVLATVAVYRTTLSVPLIYDDRLWITWNPSIQHLARIGAVLSPPAGSVVCGRPVLSLSLALNYAAGGVSAWGYHLVNVAIHILAALALFGIVRRTLAYRPDMFPTGRDRIIPAFAVALLWAVHPLQTESVTYVIQRAESLMGLFYLLTLYCFIRGVQSGSRAWHLLTVLFCLLGMATKEVMVTAPLAVLAYDRSFVAPGAREALRIRWRLYLALASTWLVLGMLMAGMRERGVGYGLGYSGWSYALTECWVVVHYLILSFWPFPLVLDYGTDIVGSVRQAIPWACILAALVLAAFLAFRRRTLLGFAGAWFLLILAPASSVVPVAFQPMAEHRMYLSLAGVMAFAVAGAWTWLERECVPLLVVVACALGAVAYERNLDYRNEISIWSDTVRRRPSNPRAHIALGSALALEDRNAEAAEQFSAALRIDPGDFQARRNLGLALYHLGRVDEALAEYRKIAVPSPDSAPLHFDIALALDGAGRTKEAIEEYARALRIDPADGQARTNLGIALFREGRVPEAVVQYGLALRALPDSARVRFNLAMALARLGGAEKAIGQYREAIRLDPGYAEAHNNLGSLLAEEGRVPEAVAQFEEALRIKPDYAMARANLEALKAGQGAAR
jgi:tetratricopeptide (TPR) repeat protein